MKAIIYEKYGPPDVLQFQDVPQPTPQDDEVLVRVHAASVNAWDWGVLTGTPFVNRILFGLFKPRNKILGCDVAGRVEAVGKHVTKYQIGEDVFGDLSGSGMRGYAEYVCAPEKALALKPAKMTYEEAAAIPQAAVMALQGIRHGKPIQPGQKVLINGAGGGAGSFAVQIAKSFGADVTGVDSTNKLEMMRSIGADAVLDFTKEDFTKNGEVYDLIFDLEAHHSFLNCRRSLKPEGVYVAAGGSMARVFQIMFLGFWVSMFGGKKMGILGLKQNKDLSYLNELYEDGKMIPYIDRRYPLSEAAEALRQFGSGDFRGKIVITV